MTQAQPLASIIIPNWNGAHLLRTCLDSLRRQSCADYEVLVVDNASTDDSRELLAREYPEVRVLALETNRGFAGGVNAGIGAARGQFTVLLNNDTEAEPTWLEELLRPLLADPAVGMAASKLKLFDARDRLHSAGDYYGADGVPGNRGAWQVDRGQYDAPDAQPPLFGACAGAAAYRRELFDVLGLFDEELNSYCEDVDFNWRARLAGYGAAYAPRAVVYHKISATGGGPLASYFVGRNIILVLAKNYPAGLFRKYWLRILTAQLKIAEEALRAWRGAAARARLRGQLAALPALPRFIARRGETRATRRATDEAIERLLARNGDKG